MYTEEKSRRGGLLKEFIMKLILIIIFVLLLIWLVPWPNMSALNPLKDQIFNANLQTMKEAGITYFTTERLPQNVGDKTTLTLQKMLDMKLLVPFTDRNGDSCDVQKSYVSLEKQETEYLMKVNLKCGEEEDYILVHLGCYSYCTTDICEAKPNSTEKPSTTPKPTKSSVTPSTSPTPSTKPTPTPTSTTTPPTYVPKYSCKIVGGKYWGKNKTIVDKETYEKECTTPTPTPTPTTTPQIIICSIVNGVYYDNAGNVTTQSNYNNVCGVVVPTPTPSTVKKQYQYKKETKTYQAAKYSSWSDWKEYVLKTNDNIKYEKTDVKEVEDLGTKYVKIGTQAAVYDTVTVTKRIITQEKTLKYALCNNWEYYSTDSVNIHRIDSDWTYVDQWYKGYNPPADTDTVRWIFQGIDYSKCGSDCVNHPFVIYRKQTREATNIKEIGDMTAVCTDIVEKDVPIYSSVLNTKKYTVQLQPAKDVYGYVHYYRVRTRSLLENDKNIINVDYQWSKYGDTNLLNNGYIYTGKTRTIN